MAKINILPKEVFNLIAAGEVVERPASVVKELVENAIDAGSSEVSIDIKNGGIDSIRVVDNGCGIEKSEIKKVILPHATSKIKTQKDLEKIGTLGFRGEALASIAAVSDVKITSRTKDEALATTLIKNANDEIIEESGAAQGTSVEVNNLFKYVPARAKFLKKSKTEEAEITNLVARYILANPNVSFKYSADGKIIYKSTGNGKSEALFAVYGKEAVNNTLAVDRTFGKARVHGFVGKPTYSKPNRTYQTLVLNGRYIQNLAVQTAVTNAYGDFLMKRQYPFYVLFIDMPLEEVDVNVHPNKMEVRFSSNINVYPWVFETVVRALHANDYNPEVLNSEPISRPNIVVPQRHIEQETTYISDSKASLNFNDYFKAAEGLFSKNQVANSAAAINNLNVKDESGNTINAASGEVITLVKEQPKEQLSFNFAPEYKVVGKLFNTYLVIEQGEEVLFIDQHAMHERILYDKLKAEIDNSCVAVQPMLFPHVFSANALESAFINEHLADFTALGFDIAPFGETSYKISSVPVVCSSMSVGTFVGEVLADVKNLGVAKTSELIKDKLATKACKAAVKGGDDLTKSQIDWLITTMQKDKTPLRCPHGRPAVVKVKKSEIEKWFKRIV